jgi:4-hydroxy-3-methylbut-2-enyl diphosphate reductase
VLAQPRGFCAGVVRAIEIVERALEAHGRVYVFHEIEHNRHAVEDLQRRGAMFVNDLAAVPEGAVTVFSALGVSHTREIDGVRETTTFRLPKALRSKSQQRSAVSDA